MTAPHDVLTDKERQLYSDLKRRELALMSGMEYGVYCSDMVRFPHVEYVDTLITAAMHGHLYKTGTGPRCVWEGDEFDGVWVHPDTGERAIFNISMSEPPRHGKSFHVSEHLPAWFLTKYPDLSVHLASYADTFAATWGAKARDHVEAHPELGIEVRNDARSNALWRVKDHIGTMKTAGAGGPLTGTGRHLGVIDDLLKNAEEAMSNTTRQANIAWYLSVWKTRKEPHPARLKMLNPEKNYEDIFCIDISMSTRWNMEDLNGWLRENEDSDWFFINMPALAFEDEDDPEYGDAGRCVLGREPGEPLCPSRFTKTALMDLRTSGEGLFWFNALYQGVPRVEEGGIISKPFRYFKTRTTGTTEEYLLDNGEIIPVFKCHRFVTVDLAATMKERSDYTVYSVWDATPGPNRRLLLVELYRMKLESADHEAMITRWTSIWNPKYVGIEDRTFGTSLIQTLKKKSSIRVKALKADKDKVMRALPFGYQIMEGNVFFPVGKDWLQSFEEEILDFPNGRHDDMIDCAGYAVMEFEAIPKTRKMAQEGSTNIHERVVDHIEKVIKKKKGAKVQRVRYR